MNHIHHIAHNKITLDLRWHILRLIREFFWSQGFTEVETPLIVRLPGQEPYLSPLKVTVHNECDEGFQGYLHTSPEYTMKKMLAAGYEKIFSLGKVFRDYESFGGTHNPEFTMIEWYRTKSDMFGLMEDIEALFKFVAKKLGNQRSNVEYETWNMCNFERIHMRDLWKRYVRINLDEYLTVPAMFKLCVEKGYNPVDNEDYNDLFYRIFLNEIEPYLGEKRLTIVHHYPMAMAALAKQSEKDRGYAERMEVYADGLELANGFSELIDADEQRRRLEEEQKQRQKLNQDVFSIDDEFIEALRTMPLSAGIALGVDRMIQLFTNCQDINSVILLPASLLFKS